MILTRAGHADAAITTVGSQSFVTLRDERRPFHAASFHRVGRAWWVHAGAVRGGGFRSSTEGAAGEPLDAVFARALSAIDGSLRPPEGPAAQVTRRFPEVARALASHRASKPRAVRAATDTIGERFVWGPLFAAEAARDVRAAYAAAVRAARAMGLGEGVEVVRRRLRARSWYVHGETLAMWETDHDPAEGLLLLLGRWKTTRHGPLPPW